MTKNLKNIIYTSIFAAIICVVTLALKIPAAGGYYHMGDAFVYLAGACLPFPYAPIAGAIGGSLADLFSGYAVYIVPTFIIKACAAACFTSRAAHILCARNFLAVLAASAVTAGGYFIAGAALYGAAGAAANVYGDLGQAAAGAAVFVALGAAIDRTKVKHRMF